MVEMKTKKIQPNMQAVYRKRKKHVNQGGNWEDPASRVTLKETNTIARLSREGLSGSGTLKELPDKLAGNKIRRKEQPRVATPGRPTTNQEFDSDHKILTKEEFNDVLPRYLRGTVTSKVLDKLNAIHTDPVIANEIRDNFISYSIVMTQGKFGVAAYLDAVTYVSYRMMGYSNKESYERTFPERMKRYRLENIEEKNIAAHITSYNKGKLVNAILERTLVPTWVLNQDIHQKAINHLAHLMLNAKSEKVQSDSASALLGHLKPPEPKEVNLTIGAREDQGLTDLKDALLRLAQQQKAMIDGGVATKEVAGQKLIERRPVEEADYEDVE